MQNILSVQLKARNEMVFVDAGRMSPNRAVAIRRSKRVVKAPKYWFDEIYDTR